MNRSRPPSRTGRTPAGREGFTLIEVVAATVILSLGVLAVAQTSAGLSTQVDRSGSGSDVARLADQRLDSLQIEEWDSLSTGVTTDTVEVAGVRYELTTEVSDGGRRLRYLEVTGDPLDGPGVSAIFTSYRVEPYRKESGGGWGTW